MYYKLIKEMPNHLLGDILYLVDIKNNEFYEWLDDRDYILPKDIVESESNFFEKINIDWNIGDTIFYLNSFGDIIENMFDPRTHLNLILVKNAFKNEKDAKKLKSEIYSILNKKK